MQDHRRPSAAAHFDVATTNGDRASPLYILLGVTLFSLLLVLSFTAYPTARQGNFGTPLIGNGNHRVLLDEKVKPSSPLVPPPAPSLAYFISGSVNDSGRMVRLLHSIYHPKNQYLLHLDTSASQADREALALTLQSVPLFWTVQNVHVIGKADNVFTNGPSSLSSTLHAASLLLHLYPGWDWFINLSAADYPLATQDDLLHILSYLPREMNFVKHSSYIGWSESRKLKPIIVDPALHRSEKSYTFFATQKRSLPDAFRLFTGSSMAILSRKFVDYCIMGTDNLPRTLLMYLSNTPVSTSIYFPTVLCNSRLFKSTTIDHSMHYIYFDSRQPPHLLNSSNFDELILSGAVFASPFAPDDPVLDRIDREILLRGPGEPVPGGWCLGDSGGDKCNVWGDAEFLIPGPGAKRLERCLVEALSNHTAPCLDQ